MSDPIDVRYGLPPALRDMILAAVQLAKGHDRPAFDLLTDGDPQLHVRCEYSRVMAHPEQIVGLQYTLTITMRPVGDIYTEPKAKA